MSNLNTKFKTKYGFDFPAETSDPQIELLIWKKWREAPYCELVTGPQAAEHGLRAARALFTRDQLTISPWTEDHFLDWTTEDFIMTIGGASCSKSNDYGLLVMLDWITDPTETYTAMASTTKEMLQVRSYESVIRYFRHLKRNPYFVPPGREIESKTMLINRGDDDSDEADATVKASIRGVAVLEGSKEKARARLQGAHLPYVRLVLDEMAQMPEAAVAARTNLSIGCRNFKFAGLANPDSFHDLASQHCTPDDPRGWNSVSSETGEWRSVYGKVRHHNGEKSPSITEEDGETKYPYLITQSRIDDIVRENRGNADSPDYWTMVKGYPPPEGTTLTVLSNKDLVAFSVQEQPDWHPEHIHAQIRVAGFDPAFTNGGDNAVLQTGVVGLLRSGRYALALEEPLYMAIKASEERPITYQLSDQVISILAARGIPVSMLAIDDSGTQSVADIVQVESHVAPIRCDFGSRASEDPISKVNATPAYKRVANQVAEIWVLFAELARNGQVRGLGAVPAAQITSRAFAEGKRPQRLEMKSDFKKRTGNSSPDEGDAVALCALAARKAAGLFPGSDEIIVPWSGAAQSRPGFGVDARSNYSGNSLDTLGPTAYSKSGLDFRR
jgi:hypothetical protein